MRILFLTLLFGATSVFAQDDATYKHFSTGFLAQLSQKTDTVLQYSRFSSEREPAIISVFLWKENGKTLRYDYGISKTDTISDNQLWKFLFVNYATMKKEKPKPFTYLKNLKNPKSKVSYDHEIGLESETCHVYIKNTEFKIWLSTMAYDKSSIDGFTHKVAANIYYDSNSKLKIKQFATQLKSSCLAP